MVVAKGYFPFVVKVKTHCWHFPSLNLMNYFGGRKSNPENYRWKGRSKNYRSEKAFKWEMESLAQTV